MLTRLDAQHFKTWQDTDDIIPILNSADSDWRNFRDALSNRGVYNEFLLSELLAQQRS